MARRFNFCAGPASIPESVLAEASEQLMDWQGRGLSVMEMSHRSDEMVGIANEAEAESGTPAASDNRIAVQVGAYRDQATARAGWAALRRQTDALSGVEYRIVRGEADIGTVYRLQALPGDMAAARRLRDALQADGVASQIKR